MVTLVVIKNPFEPWHGRQVKRIIPGDCIADLMLQYGIPGVELQATINGECAGQADIANDGDFVVLYPEVHKGGKNILAMVAMVALSVAAGNIAGAGWKIGGMTIKAGTLGAYMAATAVMFIGNTLIGRIAGQRADTGGFGDSSATYSWSGVRTMEGQNNAIAVTYGTVQSGGQTIAKNVTVVDNDEYLNWLVAAGEGPLQISDVLINDNQVSYYEGMTVETREGTNTQPVISNFNDTFFTKSLDYQLLDTERIDTAQGNATEGIVVKVEFTAGLYYAKDNGGLGEAWVELLGYYRKGLDGEWIRFIGHLEDILEEAESPDEPATVVGQREVGERITGSQSSALRREFRIDNLEPGRYYVKLKVSARSHQVTNSRASVRCYWSALTSIVYDDFSYPNIALIGIRALATDQISGSPTLKFKKTRPFVLVYDPYTEKYVQKQSDNPAWASYDMLHQCSCLKDPNTGKFEYEVRGVPARHINFDQFNEWAAFCEAKNLHINIEINALGEMLDVINRNIANVGRGMVLRFGTKYGCTWECVKQPVQMFGMGNIVAGTFEESFLPTNDRANAVELTYMDAENSFNRETIMIYGENYDTAVEAKTAQATFNGITSYEQAYREGMYQLYCNAYQIRTICFEAKIDAIACTVGDVVLVAHDVPRWAKSGRIYKIEGQDLTLPVELDDTETRYRILYRTVNDVLHTSNIEVLSNSGGWCKVRVEAPFDEEDMPNVNDVFDLAIAEVGSKPFVVKSITRAQDFTRKIECIEYNENIYNERYNIPPIEYVSANQKPLNVTGLSAKKHSYLASDGMARWRLDASWERASIGTFDVYVSENEELYNLVAPGLKRSMYSADIPEDTRFIKIVTTNGLLQSSGVTAAITDINTLMQALAVSNVRETITTQGETGTVKVTWNPVSAVNLKYYLVSFRGSEYKTINTDAEFGGVPEGSYTVSVKAVANDGTAGEPVAAAVNVTKDLNALNINHLIANVTGNTVTLSWDDAVQTDLRYYVVTFDGSITRTINPVITYENVSIGTYAATVCAVSTTATGTASTVEITVQEV